MATTGIWKIEKRLDHVIDKTNRVYYKMIMNMLCIKMGTNNYFKTVAPQIKEEQAPRIPFIDEYGNKKRPKTYTPYKKQKHKGLYALLSPPYLFVLQNLLHFAPSSEFFLLYHHIKPPPLVTV